MILISCLVVGFGAGCVEENDSTVQAYAAEDTKPYEIVIVSDNLIVVTGIKQDYYYGCGRESGYGDAFEQALTEVDQDYKVLDTTSVIYAYKESGMVSASSLAKKLIVIVEPKFSE